MRNFNRKQTKVSNGKPIFLIQQQQNKRVSSSRLMLTFYDSSTIYDDLKYVCLLLF